MTENKEALVESTPAILEKKNEIDTQNDAESELEEDEEDAQEAEEVEEAEEDEEEGELNSGYTPSERSALESYKELLSSKWKESEAPGLRRK